MEGLPRSATARLRKTFQYPTDDSSNSSPEVLDEEEQDNLIQTLRDQNEARNSQFRILLMALPALASIPYLVSLLRRSTFFLAILGLTSLASTAWLLHRQGPTETGIPALDLWARRNSSGSSNGSDGTAVAGGAFPAASSSADVGGRGGGSSRQQNQRRRRLSSFSLPGSGGLYQRQHRSPLEMHLPLLNAGLCAVLALLALVAAIRPDVAGRPGAVALGHSTLALLPVLIYAVVLLAKVVMAGVDPEGELGALRYEYKGA